MSIILILTVLSLAMLMGMLIGLLPGLPGMIGVIILLPVFAHWPVEAILLFFSCYICVTQYFGSVSALLFRVPGESSSIPALEVALKLKNFTSIVKAYRTTAFTSLVGALIGIVLFVILFSIFRHNWPYLFSTKFIVAFLTVLIILLITQDKKYLSNTLMLIAGLILSHINELPILNTVCKSVDWLCFLRSPAESTLILISLYCIPLLLLKSAMIPKINTETAGYSPKWSRIFPFRNLGLKHGLLGFFTGFAPGAGLTLASNLSNSIERQNNPRKLLSQIGAAEAANNAAAISCTIPFLFLGLPITASELIIDNFLASKFYRLNLSTLDALLPIAGYPIRFTLLLISCMLVVNLISFFLCGNFIRFYRCIMSAKTSWYIIIVKLLVISSMIAIVISSGISWTSAVFTVIIFGGIGIWADQKGKNIIGLAMMLVMGPFVVQKFLLAYNLYF